MEGRARPSRPTPAARPAGSLLHSRASRPLFGVCSATPPCGGRLSTGCRPAAGWAFVRAAGAWIGGYSDLVRFGVLGILAVWAEDGRLVAVPEAKVRALLADLLLHLGRPVSAGRLIDDLWGDDLPVHPAGALQSKVSRLRQALENGEPGGGQLVVFRPPGYLLQLDGVAVDERRFSALVERAGATEEPRARAALLADALALWRGAPLADFADAMFAQPAIVRLEE